jgi:hypothetical protein
MDQPPTYRLYIDNELLSERTFGWQSYEAFLTEHLYCGLQTGVHTLKLENLDPEGWFELKNFIVNDIAVNTNLCKSTNNLIEWKFVVDNLLGHENSKFRGGVASTH